MQVRRHVLIATVLAAVLPTAFGESAPAAPTTPTAPASAPTSTAPSSPPAAAKAKSPPRAPTLVSVTPGGTAPSQPLNPALIPGASASTAIDAVRVISRIQATPLTQRDALIREVSVHLDAAQRALLALRDRASLVGQRNGNAFVFQQAMTQARSSEQSLRKSLQAAQVSTTPSTWTTAQTDLTQSYGDYAKAIANVETASKNPVALGR